MNAFEIINEAARHGITMSLEDGRLALHADAKPPDDLLAKIKENTAAIIAHLGRQVISQSGPISEPTAAELLAENLVKSLHRHSEILDFKVDPEDFRITRIISDTATSIIGIAARASGEQLKFQRDKTREISPRLASRIEAARGDLEGKV